MRPTPRLRAGHRGRRLAAWLAAAVASTVLLAPTAPAQAAPVDDPDTLDAAVYLGEQLKAHDNRLPGFSAGSADWGLTIDAIYALVGAGVGKDVVDASVALIVSDEFTFLDFQHEENMGAFAKTALALQIAGEEPIVKGQDLVDLMRSKITAEGKVGAYSNHFGQSLSVLSLARTDEGVPQDVVDYTVGYQCTDPEHVNFGGFGFTHGSNACGSVDGDAVGMIGSALLAVRDDVDPQVFADAVTWMQNRQVADGSFPAQWSGAGNTNSAGMVAQFARELGTPAALTIAQRAEQYLTSLEVGCTQPYAFGAGSTETGGGFITSWRGAIAYDSAAFAAGAASGIRDNQQDQWRRASAQAILGLEGMPGFSQLTTEGMAADLPELSTCTLTGSAPTVDGSAEIGATLTAAPGVYRTGDVAHIGTPALSWQWFRDGDAIAGATTAEYTVTDADAGAEITVAATVTESGFAADVATSEPVGIEGPPLSAATFDVRTPARPVHRGSTVTITAGGLSDAEAWTLRIAGKKVATGTASAEGRMSATVRLPSAWKKTVAKRKVRVVGERSDRFGATTMATTAPTKLKVTVRAANVRATKKQKVTVAGLLPKERIRIKVTGKKAVTGFANANGKFNVTFKVGQKKGVKKVVVTGVSGTRKGTRTYRVR
jgi:hypothetical protein